MKNLADLNKNLITGTTGTKIYGKSTASHIPAEATSVKYNGPGFREVKTIGLADDGKTVIAEVFHKKTGEIITLSMHPIATVEWIVAE